MKNRKYMYFPFRERIDEKTRKNKNVKLALQEHDYEQYDCDLSVEDVTLIREIKAANDVTANTFCCEYCVNDSCTFLCSILTCKLMQGRVSNARTRAFKKLLQHPHHKEIRFREVKNEILAVEFDLDGQHRSHTFTKEFHYDLLRKRMYSTGILNDKELDDVNKDIEVLRQLRVYTHPPTCCCIQDYEAEEYYYNHPFSCDLLRVPCIGLCYPCLYYYHAQDPAIPLLASQRVILGTHQAKVSVGVGDSKGAILYMENCCYLFFEINNHPVSRRLMRQKQICSVCH
ncbi:MAG: hypothetical protein EOO94_02210 [Pedobacter sp.]|nr:MAG: hypothetical protein EOO94_02210 [Pedobacter sp.]